MASRAGRHRDTGRWDPPDRPSLLLLDYLESGSFGGHLDRTPGRRVATAGGAVSSGASSTASAACSPTGGCWSGRCS
jgi:hypothetical protein